tara:strand:+ start:336 stop:701 length:366 start_codon:yes stop_codon:yes gene_type:complete
MSATLESLSSQSIVSSDEISERIEEIREENDRTKENEEELKALIAIRKEGKNISDDWQHGVSLISETYFTEHAQDYVNDTGEVDTNSVIYDYIDWEGFADTMKEDYSGIMIDGTAFYLNDY